VVRYWSIDILRGVAIVLMIQVHFVDNLSSRGDGDDWLYDASALLGLVPAPFFTFLSGVSYRLWLRKQEATGRSDVEITKITLRRGLLLFGAGIAFNTLVWLPEDTFNWDVLTLIGTSLLLLAYFRKLPPGVVALIGLMVLFVSPLLRAAGDYPAYWHDQSYTYDFTLTDVLLGFLANGYFPLLPWIVFPLLGFLLGDVIYPRPGRPATCPWWVSVAGIASLVLGLVAILFRTKLPAAIGNYYVGGLTMFPATTGYVVATLGLSMVCLAWLHRWTDRTEGMAGTGRLLTFLRPYSAYSLTVYLLHHAVHLWPLWLWGTWMEDEPTYYWRQAMSPAAALALALLFMVACYYVLIFLERHGKYGFESLMRWLCE
jgi:uncharacterized membrane protein